MSKCHLFGTLRSGRMFHRVEREFIGEALRRDAQYTGRIVSFEHDPTYWRICSHAYLDIYKLIHEQCYVMFFTDKGKLKVVTLEPNDLALFYNLESNTQANSEEAVADSAKDTPRSGFRFKEGNKIVLENWVLQTGSCSEAMIAYLKVTS